MKKKNNFLISLIAILLVMINIVSVISYSNNQKYIIKLNNNFNAELTKIFIIGDSRMELLNNERDTLNIPSNIVFKARSGAKIYWLDKIAMPWLRKQLNNKNKKYKYMVLFNLGVKDLNSDTNPSIMAQNYLNIYKKIIFENQDVNFYFLSVNPIDEKVINNYFKNQKRTNKKIEEFNNYFMNNIKGFNNISYCDSYNDLDINFYDGLHFDFETNKKILNYLINNCF